MSHERTVVVTETGLAQRPCVSLTTSASLPPASPPPPTPPPRRRHRTTHGIGERRRKTPCKIPSAAAGRFVARPAGRPPVHPLVRPSGGMAFRDGSGRFRTRAHTRRATRQYSDVRATRRRSLINGQLWSDTYWYRKS